MLGLFKTGLSRRGKNTKVYIDNELNIESKIESNSRNRSSSNTESRLDTEYITIDKGIDTKTKYERIIEKGQFDLIDCIAPSAVDITSPDYLYADGTYFATILIVTYPYERTGGWLTDIINHGEGVEVNLFYEPLDKGKTIKDITQMIGVTGAKRKEMGDNQNDVDIVDTALGHARYMRSQMSVKEERPYYLYLTISVFSHTKEKLEERLRSVETQLASMDIISKRADFRQEEGFVASLPLNQLSDSLRKSTRRNALTTGLSSTYPFCSFEFCDTNGSMIGINEHNGSLVMIDMFNTAIYKNANMVILGTSGAGKTFFIQLLALRLRMQDIPIMIIAPLKGHEFKNACQAIGGQFIDLSAASNHCINIMEIRKSTVSGSYFEDSNSNTQEDKNSQQSFLLTKIQNLHIFFSLIFTDMTEEEQQYLDEKLIEVYLLKEITFDNDSLYCDKQEHILSLDKKFKPMPVLGDLYELLEADPKTKRLATILKKYVTGSLQCFNQPTNVDLNNKYIVADISNLKGKMLPIGMFIVADLFWDKIKEDITKKKTLIIDELWNLIGSGGNSQTAQFIFEIFKIIRGYGGSAVGATQDIADFFALEDGKYGKGIINNSKMKVVLQLEEEDADALQRVLKLSEEERARVVSFPRGHGLFYAGTNHLTVDFRASSEEKELITTDRAELEEIKRRKSGSMLSSN